VTDTRSKNLQQCLTAHNPDIPAPIIAILIFGLALTSTNKNMMNGYSVCVSDNNWGSKCQTLVHVSLMGVVQAGLRVHTPLPWDMVQPHLWGTSSPPGGFASTGSRATE